MKKLNGFKQLKEQQLAEVNGVVSLWEHEKTAAKLVIIKNDDKEKAFNIGFTTLPENDSGIPHILEHGVLCGSEKYPVKEPFVELLKGSLNSFLNAETFGDKTMYPLASTNNKDFLNQMGVYLDAVFFPLLKTDPMVLMQEGWHYELNEQGHLIINGVVYNEMKGAFSNPSRALYSLLNKTLFDNVYAVESGGDPEYIPNLTQKEYCAFHDKYYNPTNSVTGLYGDVDVEATTALLDSYFSRFEKAESYVVENQEPKGALLKADDDYEIAANEKEEEKANMGLAFVCCDSSDATTSRGLDILGNILSSEASPVKQALQKATLGKEISFDFDIFSKQALFAIIAEGTNENRADEFKSIVMETLTKMAEKGIDKKLVTSAVNQAKFRLKEGASGGMSKGIMLTHYALNTALYGGDLFETLAYNTAMDYIVENADKGYFEKLLSDYFVNSKHSVLAVLHPKKGLNKEKDEAFAVKMQAVKDSLGEDGLKTILQNTQALKLKQQSADTAEGLATIPHLQLDEIDQKQSFEISKQIKADLPTLWYEGFTDGIVYAKLLFNLSKIKFEDLPYVGVLTSLLAKLSTEKRDYLDLSNELGIYTGRFDTRASAYPEKDHKTNHNFLEVNAGFLVENTEKAFALISEILFSTSFEDKERVKQLLGADLNNSMMMAMNAGHASAVSRLTSYISESGQVSDATAGIGHLETVKEIYNDFDNKYPVLVEKLQKLVKQIFSKDNLTVCVTGEKAELDSVTKHINLVVDGLADKCEDAWVSDKPVVKNEGFCCPSQVQYVAQGGNYVLLGYKPNGYLEVTSNILYSSYLWNKVRVIGGAYGGMLLLRRSGLTVFVSYRDPKLAETYQAYKEVVDYLANYNSTDDEMVKSIIGAISEIDKPMTVRAQGETAVVNFFAKYTAKEAQKQRDEILSCKVMDVQKTAPLFKAVLSEHKIVTIGNAEKVEANKELFDSVKNLF